MKKWKTGVYCIQCKVTGKRYIGSSAICLTHRMCQHRTDLRLKSHHSILLQRAWDKYGEQAFHFTILEECPPEKCLEREQHWMDSHQTFDPKFGYNILPKAGSRLGVPIPYEQRQMISAKLKGRKLTEQHRKNISAGGKGQKRSEETKRKISEAIKAAHARGEKFFRGRKHSTKTRKKMSEINKGQNLGGTLPTSTKAKISASLFKAWSEGRRSARRNNQDPTTKAEAAPVLTSVSGT